MRIGPGQNIGAAVQAQVDAVKGEAERQQSAAAAPPAGAADHFVDAARLDAAGATLPNARALDLGSPLGAVPTAAELQSRAASAAAAGRDQVKADVDHLLESEAVAKLKAVVEPALERLQPVVFSAEGWGASIGVDDGKHPRPFGYGEKKDTIVESDKQWHSTTKHERASIGGHGGPEIVTKDFTTTEEHGIHGRLFGEADGQTVSAAIGAEFEAGKKTTVEDHRGGSTTETFGGTRGRVYGEAGVFGQTLGAEGFAGVDHFQETGAEKDGDESWTALKQQAWGGARGVAKVHTGPTISAQGRGEVGAGYRFEVTQHAPIGGEEAGGLGAVQRVAFDVFVGASAEVEGNAGLTGAGAKVETFAGLRLGVEERASLAADGTELVGGMGRVEGWVGVGAKAEGKVGVDWEHGRVDAKGSVGAALGAGGSLDIGVTIAGEEVLNKTVGEGEPDATDKKTLTTFPRPPKP
ncbi:MAG: hypothetical protein HYV63_31670 [Candidatus Schekmanbacteria bacterium]|nr:hypothetical protein [Candidatus Schekmanbacteria bacterium]